MLRKIALSAFLLFLCLEQQAGAQVGESCNTRLSDMCRTKDGAPELVITLNFSGPEDAKVFIALMQSDGPVKLLFADCETPNDIWRVGIHEFGTEKKGTSKSGEIGQFFVQRLTKSLKLNSVFKIVVTGDEVGDDAFPETMALCLIGDFLVSGPL